MWKNVAKWHNFLKLPQSKMGKLYFYPTFQKVGLHYSTFFQQHWMTTFSSCQMIWSVKLQLTWRIVYSVIIAAPVDCPKSSLFPDTILGEIHKSLPIFWGHCAGKRIWNWIKRWVHRSRDMLCTKWHRVKRCIVADPRPDHIAKGNLGSFFFLLTVLIILFKSGWYF